MRSAIASIRSIVIAATAGPLRLAAPASARRYHHDLDLVLRGGEPRLDGGARRGLAGSDPGVPDRVHLAECRHVGEPDIRGQELGLVGAGFRSEEHTSELQ